LKAVRQLAVKIGPAAPLPSAVDGVVQCIIGTLQMGRDRDGPGCGVLTHGARYAEPPFVQQMLIKSIPVTLNDAVASDNFNLFHAKISKPFRDQFQLGFIPSDGQWKLSGVTIDIE
jgi:hypothetical protein